MWWFAVAGCALLVALLFWPTRRRRLVASVNSAAKAFQRRDWPAFDRWMRLGHQLADRSHDHFLLGELELVAATGSYWRGEPDEVIPHVEAAIPHIEKAAAPNRSIKICMAQHLWGDVHFDRGELDQAEQHFRTAFQAVEFSPEPGVGIFTLQRLTDVLIERGKFAEAKEAAERCVQLERNLLTKALQQQGKDPGSTTMISMSMPDLCLANQDYPQAEKLFQEKVNYWSRMATRPDNVDVTRYQFHLATAQRAQGRVHDAVQTLQKACETAERDFGPQHPRVKRARQKLQTMQALAAAG